LALVSVNRSQSSLADFAYLVAPKAIIIMVFLLLGGSLVRMISAWDAAIYLRIAQTGYTGNVNLYVFAPLYPSLTRLMGGFWAAFLIANICSIASVFLLYKITNFPTALLFASFPTFLVFGTSAYADPMMMFFLILSYWLYSRKQYWPMCISLTLAILTKYTALFAIPIFLLLVAYRTRLKLRTLMAFSLPVCAMGAIMYWLWTATGDPLAFIHRQAAWGATGLVDPITQANWVLTGWFTTQAAVLSSSQPWMWLLRNYAFQIPTLALLAIALWRRKFELVAIGLPFVLLTLTTIGMPAISTPRLILPGIWVCFVAFKDQIQEHKTEAMVLTVCFVLIGLSWLLCFSRGGFVA